MTNSFWMASVTAVAISAAAPTAAAAQELTYRFHLPAQDLGSALRSFATTTREQVSFNGDDVRGKRSNALKGTFSATEALQQLTRGTGVEFRQAEPGLFVIIKSVAGNASGVTTAAPGRTEETIASEQIVVIGTHIRGNIPVASPLVQVPRDDFTAQGATSVQDVLRNLPANFGGDLTPENTAGNLPIGGIGNFNHFEFDQYAPNLRGLGAQATLSTLNGIRVPLSSSGVAPDLSLIPLLAVGRVDALEDGASPVYGSDAIAGVINLVPRRDVDVIESSAQYGTARGGDETLQLAQAVGKRWRSGSVFLAYQFDATSPLPNSARAETRGIIFGSLNIVDRSRQHSFYGDVYQSISPDVEIGADLNFSHRAGSAPVSFGNQEFTSKQLFGTFYGKAQLGGDWLLNGSVRFSKDNFDLLVSFPAFSFENNNTAYHRSTVSDFSITGSLFHLPGGDVKFAAGGEYANDRLSASSTLVGSIYDVRRTVGAEYAEADMPIVGADNALPLVHRLDLSAAIRHDHYSGVGSTTNPRVGLVWLVSPTVRLRGTYSTAFRAPPLFDVAPGSSFTEFVPDTQSASGQSIALVAAGTGAPGLRPETSRNFTLGADYQPQTADGLKAHLTYYDVRYRNRIAPPDQVSQTLFLLGSPFSNAFAIRNPAASFVDPFLEAPFPQFQDFTGVNPSAADIAAFIDDRETNLVATSTRGLDFSASYKWQVNRWRFELRSDSTALLKYVVDFGHGIPPFNERGEAFFPAKFRSRDGIIVERGPWLGNVFVNYTSGSHFSAFPPTTRVGSWTTVDAYLNYRSPGSGPFGGFTINARVNNLFNQRPPHLTLPLGFSTFQPQYDPANSSVIGRFVALQITKRW